MSKQFIKSIKMIAIMVPVILMSVVLQSVGAGLYLKPYQSPIGRQSYLYPQPLHINNNFHTPLHLVHHPSINSFGAGHLFNHKIVVRSADQKNEDDDSDGEDELRPKEKSSIESQSPKDNSHADKPKVTVLHNGETLFESDKCLSAEKSGKAKAKPDQHSHSHYHNTQGPHYVNEHGYPMMMIPNFPPNQPLGQASPANIPSPPIQLPKYGPGGPSQSPDLQQYAGYYIPPGQAPSVRKPPSSYARITPIYIYQYGVPDIPPQQTINNPSAQLSQQNLPLPVTTNPSLSYPSTPIQIVELGPPGNPTLALSQPSVRNLTWDRNLVFDESPPYPTFSGGQLFQYGNPSGLPPQSLSPVAQYYLEHNIPYGQKPGIGYSSSPYTSVPNYGLPALPQPLIVPVTQNQPGQDTVGSQQNQLLIQTVKPVGNTRIGPGQIMNYPYQPLPQTPPVPGQENPQVQPYFITPIRLSNDQIAPNTNQKPCPSLYQKPSGRTKMLSILSPDKYMEAIDKHMHPYMFN